MESSVSRATTQGEKLQFAVDLGITKGGRFGFGEGTKFTGAGFDGAAGEMIGQGCGFGAWALRIREDVEIGEGTIFDETQGGGVIRFGFAGKTGDDVRADGGVRQAVADEFNAAGIMFGAIPAVHGREDLVGSRLQRHVEMRGEAIGGGEKIDEVGGNVEWFDGTDAETLHGSFVENAAQKIEKFDSGRKIAAVGAEIDATENDFVKAGIGKSLNFRNNGSDGKAAGFSANKRNDTERASRIAAILDLEGWARVIPFSAENGCDEHVGELGNVAS